MVISVEKLTRAFGDTLAVDSVTFEVAHGEVFGLLGHNGAGKTTTVRLLTGLLEPTSGRASVFGLDPALQGSAVRRRTGVSTETPSVDDRMSGRAALRYFSELYDVPKAEVEGRVAELLETYGLSEAADDRIGSYSKGMKQRLALARTLIHRPELLFLDEPTSGLDPVAARAVNDLITRLSRDEGRTVLLCTHNLAQAQELCDRVAVLDEGRVMALGTPSRLARDLGRRQSVVITVAAADAERAHLLVQAQPEFGDVSRDGDTLRVAAENRERIPELVILLAATGVRIYGVSVDEPSLEDVYFALHEQQRRARA